MSLVVADEQVAEKFKFLSFRGALRAEESLFSWAQTEERFFASLRMTKIEAIDFAF
jgi:hypothetical protein